MTGYGRGIVSADGREITIELKSVNHRFLDVSMRLPRHLLFLEDRIRRQISESLKRGHVDVFLNYRNTRNDAKQVVVNTPLLVSYVEAAHGANESLRLPDDFGLAAALNLPGVTEVLEADEDQDAVAVLCHHAVEAALKELVGMRTLEGARLLADLTKKADTISALADKIEQRAPGVVTDYRDRLRNKITQLLETGDVDETRLAMEVAVFADRAAVDEEVVRLHSHVRQMQLLFQDPEPVGKRLDFIVQEINREFNTIGSKANDTELTNLVLSGKTETEKIREQIQNIE